MTDAKIDAAIRRLLTPIPASPTTRDWVTDKAVLLFISMGLVTILLAIIIGLFLTPRALPNWAENVFVSIATATALKLGDCVNAIVALSGGRTVERLGTQLASSAPSTGETQSVVIDQPADQPIPTTETKP